ncbi:hypothetical protein [Paenibacillus favisporus]|uniref:hypothetical protein n=1 Tax=Paenibacillus favisporus TaxID=221028 RepID=UPI003D2E9485
MNIDFLKQLQRILRLKDLEAWDVAMNGKDCRIIIKDEGRPSRDEDFPWLKDGIGEDKRENHITAHVFSSTSLEKSEEHIVVPHRRTSNGSCGTSTLPCHGTLSAGGRL